MLKEHCVGSFRHVVHDFASGVGLHPRERQRASPSAEHEVHVRRRGWRQAPPGSTTRRAAPIAAATSAAITMATARLGAARCASLSNNLPRPPGPRPAAHPSPPSSPQPGCVSTLPSRAILRQSFTSSPIRPHRDGGAASPMPVASGGAGIFAGSSSSRPRWPPPPPRHRSRSRGWSRTYWWLPDRCSNGVAAPLATPMSQQRSAPPAAAPARQPTGAKGHAAPRHRRPSRASQRAPSLSALPTRVDSALHPATL